MLCLSVLNAQMDSLMNAGMLNALAMNAGNVPPPPSAATSAGGFPGSLGASLTMAPPGSPAKSFTQPGLGPQQPPLHPSQQPQPHPSQQPFNNNFQSFNSQFQGWLFTTPFYLLFLPVAHSPSSDCKFYRHFFSI